MLPKNVRGWLELLEDVLACPAVANLEETLIQECIAHREFQCISMDCTLRIAMRVKGQANYREGKEGGGGR